MTGVIGVVAHSPTLSVALLVALAGGVGATGRALLIHHIALRTSDPLPVGTIVVNASGSLVLGFLTGLSLYHSLGPHTLTVLGLGLCGGYTTFSTASWESLHLLRSGHRREAVVYTFGGLAVCVVGAIAGLALAAVV
jgi:CrcB protein